MLDNGDFAVSEWNQWIRATYGKIPTVSLQLNPRVRIEKRQGEWQVWVNGYQMRTTQQRVWSHYAERMIERFGSLREAKHYILSNPGVIKSEIELLESDSRN